MTYLSFSGIDAPPLYQPAGREKVVGSSRGLCDKTVLIADLASGPVRAGRNDPFWFELYSKRLEIKNSVVTLCDDPGMGVGFDPAALAK